MWFKIQGSEGQNAGFGPGPCVHFPEQPILVPVFGATGVEWGKPSSAPEIAPL